MSGEQPLEHGLAIQLHFITSRLSGTLVYDENHLIYLKHCIILTSNT